MSAGQGPGDSAFHAELRRRWLVRLREVMPAIVTDEEFHRFVAELDKIHDESQKDVQS